MNPRTVRLCHLYPAEMSIYADRGNIAVLARRLEWRNLALEVTEAHLGDTVDATAHDLFYMGGGQDRDQNLVAADLVELKAAALRSAFDDGAAGLFVCGGIQLAGHGYETANGQWLDGIGALDLETRAGESRLIGDLVIDATLNAWTMRLVGYENHVGRTHLGPDTEPLGKVLHGHGNNAADGLEGAVSGRVIGTYLHGPLLPKNPDLADAVLSWALEYHYGETVDLQPLDDSIERQAHEAAEARAGVSR
jgi:CobQ-like glutamine amidotransferase family enzyme